MAKSLNGEEPKPRSVRWIGSSKDDLSAFPDDVKRRVGRALWDAQIGLKAPFEKPLNGFRQRRRPGGRRRFRRGHVPRGLLRPIRKGAARATRVQEEVSEGHRDTQIGDRADHVTDCRGLIV